MHFWRGVPAWLLFASLALHASQTGVVDLAQRPVDPFAERGVNVFVFLRTDCPISNRYAPELARIADEFQLKAVRFWMIYPDRSESSANVKAVVGEYHFPGTTLLDHSHLLVKRAHAETAPEAAVFSSEAMLVYHGRIDDRYLDFGKSRPAAQVHDLESAISATLSGKPILNGATKAIGCSLADVE